MKLIYSTHFVEFLRVERKFLKLLSYLFHWFLKLIINLEFLGKKIKLKYLLAENETKITFDIYV